MLSSVARCSAFFAPASASARTTPGPRSQRDLLVFGFEGVFERLGHGDLRARMSRRRFMHIRGRRKRASASRAAGSLWRTLPAGAGCSGAARLIGSLAARAAVRCGRRRGQAGRSRRATPCRLRLAPRRSTYRGDVAFGRDRAASWRRFFEHRLLARLAVASRASASASAALSRSRSPVARAAKRPT